MSEKELNKLVRQIKKLDNSMCRSKVLKGMEMCKLHGIQITPYAVLSGYCSFYR